MFFMLNLQFYRRIDYCFLTSFYSTSRGFAFIYMEDERDAEYAIRRLDRREFGRHGRKLRVEWSKQEQGSKRSASDRRSTANSRPSKTLFVINFDPINTRMKDLERHFEAYGKVVNVRMKKNFAFIQFESQDEATKALEATNMSKLMDRVISVEYAVRDDDVNRNGHYPESDRRGKERSLDTDRRERATSPEPERRGRARSREPEKRARDRTPEPEKRRHRSPEPDKRGKDRSPDSDRKQRNTSPEKNHDHGRSKSPYTTREEQASPVYVSPPSPHRKHPEKASPRYKNSESPAYKRRYSCSPAKEE